MKLPSSINWRSKGRKWNDSRLEEKDEDDEGKVIIMGKRKTESDKNHKQLNRKNDIGKLIKGNKNI